MAGSRSECAANRWHARNWKFVYMTFRASNRTRRRRTKPILNVFRRLEFRGFDSTWPLAGQLATQTARETKFVILIHSRVSPKLLRRLFIMLAFNVSSITGNDYRLPGQFASSSFHFHSHGTQQTGVAVIPRAKWKHWLLKPSRRVSQGCCQILWMLELSKLSALRAVARCFDDTVA